MYVYIDKYLTISYREVNLPHYGSRLQQAGAGAWGPRAGRWENEFKVGGRNNQLEA